MSFKPKKGFKVVKLLFQKEIEIPDKWDLSVLGKHCTFFVPMRDKPKKFDGHIPWLRIEDFDGKFVSDTNSGQYVTSETVKEMKLRIYPVGTVLCSCSATIGVCAITKKELITNQTFIGIFPDSEINNEYLYYFLLTQKNNLKKIGSGTTILYISRKKFEQFPIILPPLSEQKKIVSIISNIDSLISSHSKLLSQTIRLKQGMIQKLLTKGIGHKKFKKIKTLFRRTFTIPESWNIISLYDTTTKKSNSIVDGPFGSNLKISDYDLLGTIPVLTIKMLYNIDKVKFARCITKEKFSEIERSKIQGNDIVMAKIGNTYGVNCIYPENFPVAMISANICKITVDSTKFDRKYLKFWFDSKFFKNFLDVIVTSSAQPAFGITNFKKLPFIAPPLLEQQKITSILSEMNSKINDLESKLINLKILKKELMQKLLTGQIRVSV